MIQAKAWDLFAKFKIVPCSTCLNVGGIAWVHCVNSQGDCFFNWTTDPKVFFNWTTDPKVSVREKLTLSKTISLHIHLLWRTQRWCSGSCCNVLYVTRMPNQKKRFACDINMELQ